jgi:phage repressor protein C with HTH and peptisase S24 domain
MTNVDQRAVLERLIQDRREDYASLSRLIGRNSAYIQQFIRRGVPKRLSEGDRHTLARYFGILEVELGGPGQSSDAPRLGSSSLIAVPRLNVDASAGPGAFNDSEGEIAHIGFDEKWLRRVSRSKSSDLSVINVQGDSMTPTLSDGDDILVDAGDGAERLRDGIYVLRRDDALLVKRIAPSPASRRIIIKSDNDSYPSWPDCEIGDVEIIGRVVWVGRRLR